MRRGRTLRIHPRRLSHRKDLPTRQADAADTPRTINAAPTLVSCSPEASGRSGPRHGQAHAPASIWQRASLLPTRDARSGRHAVVCIGAELPPAFREEERVGSTYVCVMAERPDYWGPARLSVEPDARVERAQSGGDPRAKSVAGAVASKPVLSGESSRRGWPSRSLRGRRLRWTSGRVMGMTSAHLFRFRWRAAARTAG